MSIFTIEPYENLTTKLRRKDTITIEMDFCVPNDIKSYQGVLKYVEEQCDREFAQKTKEMTNVVQTSIEVDNLEDYSVHFTMTIGIEYDETKQEYLRRRQYEINKLKKNMDKDEVRKIEEADRLKKEYNQYLQLQEKFKGFDPATLH